MKFFYLFKIYEYIFAFSVWILIISLFSSWSIDLLPCINLWLFIIQRSPSSQFKLIVKSSEIFLTSFNIFWGIFFPFSKDILKSWGSLSKIICRWLTKATLFDFLIFTEAYLFKLNWMYPSLKFILLFSIPGYSIYQGFNLIFFKFFFFYLC